MCSRDAFSQFMSVLNAFVTRVTAESISPVGFSFHSLSYASYRSAICKSLSSEVKGRPAVAKFAKF